MTGGRRVAAALHAAVLAAVLAGCATAPSPAPEGDRLTGRLGVRVDADATAGQPARSVSAGFDLAGTGQAGRLDLTSPLGTVVAQATWTPAGATLVTSDGTTRHGDLDGLTREVLGESLPVAALFDWLRGRPWDGAPSTPAPAGGEPGFEQLGWAVRLGRFDEGWVVATRARPPQVTVRAQVER